VRHVPRLAREKTMPGGSTVGVLQLSIAEEDSWLNHLSLGPPLEKKDSGKKMLSRFGL